MVSLKVTKISNQSIVSRRIVVSTSTVVVLNLTNDSKKSMKKSTNFNIKENQSKPNCPISDKKQVAFQQLAVN